MRVSSISDSKHRVEFVPSVITKWDVPKRRPVWPQWSQILIFLASETCAKVCLAGNRLVTNVAFIPTVSIRRDTWKEVENCSTRQIGIFCNGKRPWACSKLQWNQTTVNIVNKFLYYFYIGNFRQWFHVERLVDHQWRSADYRTTVWNINKSLYIILDCRKLKDFFRAAIVEWENSSTESRFLGRHSRVKKQHLWALVACLTSAKSLADHRRLGHSQRELDQWEDEQKIHFLIWIVDFL